ncbi:MAG TPA: ATP-binding protein [Candidatus Eisenbacteria bacterium]|nr:ATP-binding protein [Candidatus Eisenbacteria bacterium]
MPKADKQPPDTITLTLPSRLELLGLLDRVTAALCERMELDEATASQVSMSVIEAGTNAIQHGHRRDPNKLVDVRFDLWPDRIEISVHDTGAGFDVSRVNGDVTSPEHLFDARGRGIYIMRACMDEVAYDVSASGTTCHLVKRRPAKASAAAS